MNFVGYVWEIEETIVQIQVGIINVIFINHLFMKKKEIKLKLNLKN